MDKFTFWYWLIIGPLTVVDYRNLMALVLVLLPLARE
jgi:hypothetical protein